MQQSLFAGLEQASNCRYNTLFRDRKVSGELKKSNQDSIGKRIPSKFFSIEKSEDSQRFPSNVLLSSSDIFALDSRLPFTGPIIWVLNKQVSFAPNILTANLGPNFVSSGPAYNDIKFSPFYWTSGWSVTLSKSGISPLTI